MRTVKRALSLLKADQGLRDREIADVLLVNPATVARARKRYVAEGLEAAIPTAWPGRERRRLDGRQEAHLAFACSGRARRSHRHWTLLQLSLARPGPRASPWQIRCARYWSNCPKRPSQLKPWKKKECRVSPGKVSGLSSWRQDGGRAGAGRPPTGVPPKASGSASFGDLPAIDWGGAQEICPSRLPPDGWHAMTPSTSETGPGTCS